MIQLHSRQAGRLQGIQIPPASLDVEYVDFFSEGVFSDGFHRGVATAMKYQRKVGSYQP